MREALGMPGSSPCHLPSTPSPPDQLLHLTGTRVLTRGQAAETTEIRPE